MRSTLVALWAALHLLAAAPLARALAAAPDDGQQLAAQQAHDVVLARSGARPPHRLAFHAPPFLPPHHALVPAPTAGGSAVSQPSACCRASTQLPRFSGPRGPPYVVAS
jgi:hypothetical protein